MEPMTHKCSRCEVGWNDGDSPCFNCNADVSTYRVSLVAQSKETTGSSNSFSCIVDRTITREEQISKATIIHDASKKINEYSFPRKNQESSKVNLEYFNLKEELKGKEVGNKIKKEGYRPATLSELLSFAEQYPEECTKGPIVALGSTWIMVNLSNLFFEFVVYSWCDSLTGKIYLECERFHNTIFGTKVRFLVVKE